MDATGRVLVRNGAVVTAGAPAATGGPALVVRDRCTISLDPARQHRLDRFEDCTVVLPVPDTGAIQTAHKLCGARSRTLA